MTALVVFVTAWLTVVVTIALWVVIPIGIGWRPVTVTSGSMAPRIRAGDLVMYDRGARHPGPGAIVVFRRPGTGELLTHRVAAVTAAGELRTRGDANPTNDAEAVPLANVRGRVRLVIPGAGALLRNRLGLVLVLLAPCAGVALLGALARPRRQRRAAPRAGPRVALAGMLVVALVATSVGVAQALAFSSTTANAGSSFSTFFVPNTAPDSLSASLGIVGAVQVAVISGSVLYVGGDFTAIGGVTRNRLAAIDLATDTLTGWDPNVNNTVNALAVDAANNVVYAGGAFTTVNGFTVRNRLAAISTVTGTATAWDPNAGNTVSALALDAANNVVYAGGAFTTVNGATARNRIAAISTVTGTATAWDPNAGNTVSALALDATNNVVYAGGAFTTVNGATARNRIAAISTVTGTATAWDPNASNTVSALVLDSTNNLLYAGGTFTVIGSQTRNRIASLSTANAQATAWDPNANNAVNALALDPAKGIVYAGGTFTSIGGATRNRIAALSVATGNAATWNPNADSTVATVAVATAAGRVAFGGSFTAIELTDRAAIAATAAATTTDPDAAIPTTIDVGTTGAVRAAVLSGTTLYIGGDFTRINGTARKHLAAIDTTTGTLTAWNPTTDATVRAFALDTANNVLYAGGDFTNAGGSLRQRLAAFATTNGALTSWSTPTNGSVNALAVDPASAVVYVAGAFTTIGGHTRNRLAAVSTATGVVTNFDANLSAPANALALDAANSLIYVGGSFTTVNGATARNRVAALSTATATATAWDPNANSIVRALVLDGVNGLVYIAGEFTTVNGGTTRNRLAAIATSNAVASAWNADVNNAVYALALDAANGALYTGGPFTTVNGGTARNRLAALSTSTATATAWNPNVGALNVYALAVDLGAATAYVGGDFTTVGGVNREALAAVTGGPAGAASLGALSVTSANNLGGVYAAVRTGSTLYLGGTFTYVAGQARNRLAAIDLATDTVTSWNPNVNNTVRALAVAGGVVYAGGDFTTVNNGTARNRLAALSTTTATATAWNPNLNGAARALALDVGNSQVYVAGDFTTVNGGTTRNRLAALSTATATATAWNPNLSNSAYAVALDIANSVLYASGTFTTVNGGTARNRVAAFSTASGTATAFDPDANGTTAAIALDATNGLLYAGGDFTTLAAGTTTRNRLAAVSTATALATSWNPNVNSTVNALALDATNGAVYATGAFTTVGGLTRNRLAAVWTSTGQPADWNPSANSTGRTLVLDSGEVVAGGDFTTIGPGERGGWARFGLAPAVQSPSYLTAVRAVTGATAANVYATAVIGNTLYVGGDFTSVGTVPRRRLAAFDLTTNTLTSWNPSVDNLVRTITVDAASNLVYAGGDFVVVNYTTTRNRVAAFPTVTGTATSFDPNSNNTVRALALDATRGLLYAGGDFTTVNGGTARNRIVALSTSTATASTWDPNSASSVFALAIDASNNVVYAGGSFTTVNGATTRNRIAAFDATTGTTTAWDANANNTVRALALDPVAGSLYAGGDFTTVNGGTTRNRIAALSTSTGTASAWNPNLNGLVYALALDGGGLAYLAGTFTTVNGWTVRNRAVSVSTATATATSWNPNLGGSAWTLTVSVPIKRLAVGGVFTTVGGQPRAGLATFGP